MTKDKAVSDKPLVLKELVSSASVQRLARALTVSSPEFNESLFLKVIPKLSNLELKARVQAVCEQMNSCLPADYLQALKIVEKALQIGQFEGFDLWAVSSWIEQQGLQHENQSLVVMSRLTEKFTSEFAVRPFLLKNPKGTFNFLKKQAQSSNVHHRRWASEGSRPRLPWGQKLNCCIQDPKPGLEILDLLKFDSELYVRKSVANHLNDISKDHPKLVVQTLKDWRKGCPSKHLKNLQWIEKHALRTLVKKGDPLALKFLGFGEKPQLKLSNFKIDKKSYRIGESLNLSAKLSSAGKKAQNLVIDYVVSYQKAKGQLSAKVFKLKNAKLLPGSVLPIEKVLHLKNRTTRTLHPGLHKIALQINGVRFGELTWQLTRS